MGVNIKDTGFLLRRIPWSESSLILKAYTREHGLISFMAKGAKRQNSRLHGLLEPALHLQFLFPGNSRGEIRILSDVALLRNFSAVREDVLRQSLAQVYGEVLLKYLPGEARAPDFHDLMLSALERLEGASRERNRLPVHFAAYLLDFCRLSGFQPQFRFCVHCDTRVSGAVVAFHVDQGGPACSRCQREEVGALRLREGTLRWLDAIQNGSEDARTGRGDEAEEDTEVTGQSPGIFSENFPADFPNLNRTDALRAEEFLLLYLGRHAGGQKPLKALSVWHSLLDAGE